MERLGKLAGEHLNLTGEATEDDVKTIRRWLETTDHTPDSIERLLIGLRRAIEAGGLVPLVEPGQPASFGIFGVENWNGRSVSAWAWEWGEKEDVG